MLARGRRLPCFQRRGQRGQALLEHAEGIAVAVNAGKLIDLGRQRVHVFGEPGQRVVGGDVGDDAAQRRDRAFELLHGRRIVVRAQDQIELGAEIADRLVVAGELLGRRQRAQHLADFAERALDAGQRLAVAAVLSVLVDAAGQRADFVLERFDLPARHRFGDGVADFGEFAAERDDRLLDMIGTLQRFDLAGDLEQVPFERRKIRPGRRCLHHGLCRIGLRKIGLGGRCGRRGMAWRHLARRRTVEFVLARGDFGDRKIQRGRAERRRGAIDLGCGPLDLLGLTLLFLHLGLPGRRWVGNLRQPRIEARNGVVELAGHRRLATGGFATRRLAARRGPRNLLDLLGDRIQPLVNVGNVGDLPRHRRPLLGRRAETGRGWFADGRIEPVVQRHAGAARRRLGPFADRGIDAVNTPRYARIHAFVRFRFGAPPAPSASPRVPPKRQSYFRAARLPRN